MLAGTFLIIGLVGMDRGPVDTMTGSFEAEKLFSWMPGLNQV